tara:strand:- start:304 stop:450 length:147 start_codon:yes stop_codon:yes gene_type:complete
MARPGFWAFLSIGLDQASIATLMALIAALRDTSTVSSFKGTKRVMIDD